MADPTYHDLMVEVTERLAKAKTPFAAQVELTKRCNLDCLHCYVDHRPQQPELSTEELHELIDALADLGVLQIGFTGGEIFLHPDLWDLIEHARQRSFMVRLLTNGTRLTQADVQRLKELCIGEVHISVYSDRPEIHDEITRHPGSLEKSLRAIRWLREAEIAVVIKTPVLQINREDIKRVVHLAESLGCRYMLDTNIIPAENQVRQPELQRLNGEQLAAFFQDPELVNYLYHGGGVTELCGAMKNDDQSGRVCEIGRSMIVIDAVGNVQPCAVYPPIGNIREQSVREIWRESPELERLRENDYAKQTKCPSCEYLPYCSPCAAMAKLENNDDRACNRMSRNQAQALQLAELRELKRQPNEEDE